VLADGYTLESLSSTAPGSIKRYPAALIAAGTRCSLGTGPDAHAQGRRAIRAAGLDLQTEVVRLPGHRQGPGWCRAAHFPQRSFVHEPLRGPVPDALRGFLAPVGLDGEIMVIDDHWRPDFEALQQRLGSQDASFPDTAATWYLTACTSTATRCPDADWRSASRSTGSFGRHSRATPGGCRRVHLCPEPAKPHSLDSRVGAWPAPPFQAFRADMGETGHALGIAPGTRRP
jgi:hypothetical protein